MGRRASRRDRADVFRILAVAIAAVVAVEAVVYVVARREPYVPKRGISMYRGLGTWVDIYETAVWSDPEKAVEDMGARKVRTLYLQTSNYSRDQAVVFPEETAALLDAAHDRGIAVVAWYLPGLADPAKDLERSIAAIRFESGRGDRFDSFGLDIEASEVKDPAERSQALLQLSADIRDRVGPHYALGAITPNPVRVKTDKAYWPGFPYAGLADVYDVFVPMDYFGAVADGKKAAYRYTKDGIGLVRSEARDPAVPVHVIGGLAEDLSRSDVRGFVDAARDERVIGISLYNFSATHDSEWGELAA